VFVAAATQGVLLDAAADFVDDLGAEPDHVEDVEPSDRVREAVADCVVESGRGRCPAFLLARFPDPLPEPDV
jgi:hypothetical protein